VTKTTKALLELRSLTYLTAVKEYRQLLTTSFPTGEGFKTKKAFIAFLKEQEKTLLAEDDHER
jgi:hypothetical protein